jgi:cytochrome c553
MRCALSVPLVVGAVVTTLAQDPKPVAPDPRQNKVDSPTVKVLTGLNVPQFEQEMQGFVQAIGVSCGGCHAPRGNFASDENPRKVKARQMIELTKAINKQYFPEHTPAEGESTLGRVTCYTCHQGDAKPKIAP